MSQIFITQYDLDRLQDILAKRLPHDEYDDALLAELGRAEVIDTKDIPSDVITMNSDVVFTDETGKSGHYSLVFPEDADINQSKISILSPIGCSLIGYEVGSVITVPTPSGQKKITVTAVTYQPERSGDVDL